MSSLIQAGVCCALVSADLVSPRVAEKPDAVWLLIAAVAILAVIVAVVLILRRMKKK